MQQFMPEIHSVALNRNEFDLLSNFIFSDQCELLATNPDQMR